MHTRLVATPSIALLLLLSATPGTAQRLPTTVVPEHYDLAFSVELARARFAGTETIEVQVGEPTARVVVNALDIDFDEVTVSAEGSEQSAEVTVNEETQTATFTLARPIPAGPARIHIRYRGRLNDNLRGFYLSQRKGYQYAVTQFESTDARRAFPCFDEPAFKATFAITVNADRGQTVISNGRMLSDRPGASPRRHTMSFATTPRMSTYLVALAVGDFQCLEGKAGDIPVRICATADKKDLGQIALESAQWILKYYDGYFAIKYPFGKLDIVAVPDFAAGAMENTAAIFYREADLLADAGSASIATRKKIASILAHEMAHQWFGDLVTMRWWDDIWLNEGFATWMANHPLDAVKPQWQIPVDEELENQVAMSLDSLRSTRPIHSPVETPGEIEEAFDAIAYQKGAAVLRMIERYVGADTFRAGVNAYLQKFAYGNATSEDFWTAIAAASGKPVDRILPTFINQSGYPLIEVSAECRKDGSRSRTDVSLRQRRFVVDSSAARDDDSSRWAVPVCLKAGGQPDATCGVVSDETHVLTLDSDGCAPWVFANAGAKGYYRTAYSPKGLRALVPHVEAALTAPERLSLVADEWALLHAGRHSAGDYLALASGFGGERASGVLETLTDRLGFLGEYVTIAATRPAFERFVRGLVRPILDEIGFTPNGSDSDDRRSLRAVVIGTLGTIGNDTDLVVQARQALNRALAEGQALDPATSGAIVRVAAEHGDPPLYDALLAAAGRATSPEEQYRYLYALSDFRDPALIERSLRYALSPDLRSQDTPVYLAGLFGNPAARDRTWAFVKAHWAELEPKVTISLGDVTLVSSLGAFCDAGTRDDIKAFFAAHKLPAAVRTLDQTLERIDSCLDLKTRQTRALATWLTGEEAEFR